ncbi:MAG: hypothetical protein IH961_04280 [Chloroflexi bacterium]|nr:hypothetical protein [Chloroflexota bacterium]
MPDGSVPVFGGVGPEGFVTASEIYRPDSGEWESAAEMVAPYLLTNFRSSFPMAAWWPLAAGPMTIPQRESRSSTRPPVSGQPCLICPSRASGQ